VSREVERASGAPPLSERVMDGIVADQLIGWGLTKGKTKAREKLREELEEYASSLAGPNPTPIERTLSETAALAWFALRLHELQFVGGATSERGLTLAQSEHHQRRIDRAHRRLMSTLKTLAAVRRLGLPAVQINIAKKQVNVAGG
jgi:hypothetical protein